MMNFNGAITTVLTLFGGLALGLVAGTLLFNILPGGSVDNPTAMHIGISAIPALAGFLLGGATWGWQMGKLANAENLRRMALAGMWGFGPITLILALGLGAGEPFLLAMFSASTGIHRIFTLLFVPSAFLIAGVSTWALGRGLRDNALANLMFWQVGLSAGGTFLVINLGMEAAGWVVGAPGAAARATMLTVMAAGNLGAAFVGGGILGKILSNRSAA